MTDDDSMILGPANWPVSIPMAKRIAPPVRVRMALPTSELIRKALEEPVGFEPMRRAIMPEDRVVIVVDDALPKLPDLLTGIIEHLGTAGVKPDAVTLLLAPPAHNQGFIDDLPDELSDVTVEVHDPSNEKRMSYLATSTGGRRVYLNRTLVEADFTVVLTGRRFDPVTGISGGVQAIFPTLSNDATRAEFDGKMPVRDPLSEVPSAEISEIAWLLGTPFFVQVIEGANGSVDSIVAGLADSLVEGDRRQRERWIWSTTQRTKLVIATANGDLADYANALANAGRLLDGMGQIVLLAPPTAVSDEAFLDLRNAKTPAQAASGLQQDKPEGMAAAMLWALSARLGTIWLGPDWTDANQLFAKSIDQAQLQALVDAAESVTLLPDAHLLFAQVN